MSGFFGIASKKECITELFYGTDYHSHLGTNRAGMSTFDVENGKVHLNIHNISNSYFRTKFMNDLEEMKGKLGIGVISDTEPQPVVVNSHLGRFAVCTVARINNIKELTQECLSKQQQFAELSMGGTNATELVALLITQGNTLIEGINNVFQKVKGSCSMLVLTDDGIYCARDRYGRTPIVIGKGEHGYAVASENHSFINLGYETCKYVGPGEIVLVTSDDVKTVKTAYDKMQVCSFLWIYYGYPCVEYEDINNEVVRQRLGYEMGKNDDIEADFVSAIPDSGIGMAQGYSEGKGIPYKSGFLKYTPTWSRSFMPVNQESRQLVAKMKLIPCKKVLQGKDVVFCDDSIVRGTQLRDQVKMLYDCGCKHVHVRISCPPLVHGCNWLNFSASKTEKELIALRCIEELEGGKLQNIEAYKQYGSKEYNNMVELIRKRVGVDTLKFNSLETVVNSIGLPKDQVCVHCFDGSSYGE